MMRTFVHMLLVVLFWSAAGSAVHAQTARKSQKVGAQAVWGVIGKDDGLMSYDVEDGDTIYFGTIRPSKVYSRLPKQKGREWRQYYRLVHNFSKAYPYALVARKLVHRADSTIAADKLRVKVGINVFNVDHFGVSFSELISEVRNLAVLKAVRGVNHVITIVILCT